MEPCPQDVRLRHVHAVSTGNWTVYDRIWPLEEISWAIAQGDRFYVQSRSLHQVVEVLLGRCPGGCDVTTLRLSPDAPAEMSLADLPLLAQSPSA